MAVSITLTVDRMSGSEYYIYIVTLFSEMSAQGTVLCMFVLNFSFQTYLQQVCSNTYVAGRVNWSDEVR